MTTIERNYSVGRPMREPLFSIVLDKLQRVYQPGEALRGEYQIDAIDPSDLRAVELSVLWYSEGKGEEDLAVHYFERLTAENDEPPTLHELHRFEVTLPNSPLSYEGVFIKIRWCVRLRVFLRQGKDFVSERDFQLGEVPFAQPVQP